jgi:hypothetical protein
MLRLKLREWAQWSGFTSTSLHTTPILGLQGGGNRLFSSVHQPLRWLYQGGNEFPSHNS